MSLLRFASQGGLLLFSPVVCTSACPVAQILLEETGCLVQRYILAYGRNTTDKGG
jgi:hypothetical protein